MAIGIVRWKGEHLAGFNAGVGTGGCHQYRSGYGGDEGRQLEPGAWRVHARALYSQRSVAYSAQNQIPYPTLERSVAVGSL